jgi:hypothetical protein
MLWQVFIPSSGRYTGAKRTSLYFDQWIHNLDCEASRMSRPSRIDIQVRRVTRRIFLDQHISYMGTKLYLSTGIAERNELGAGR